MVQKVLGRVLFGGRNHRSVFHLGAAPATFDRSGIANFSSTRDRHHRQLLLLQFAHDRALPLAHR